MSLPIKSLEVIHGTGRRNHLVDRSEGEGVHPNSRQDGPNLLAEGRSSSAVPASQEQSNRQECGLQGQVSGQWSTRYGRGDSIDGSGLILVPKEMSPMEIEAFRPHLQEYFPDLQDERPIWESLDACYADTYEPKFPSPVEILLLCVLMPIFAAVRVARWLRDQREVSITIAVVSGLALGALWITITQFLHGGVR